MKTRPVLLMTLAAALTLPLAANVQGRPKAAHPPLTGKAGQAKMAAAPMYECSICHHKANAAQAKKLHYTCPVDNGKLVLIKTASLRKPH